MYPQQYPASVPPPAYSNEVGFNSLSQTNDERMSKFQHLVNRYEINREFATRLRGLEGYEIVFIVDGKMTFNKNILLIFYLTNSFIVLIQPGDVLFIFFFKRNIDNYIYH
jgi:hypothetical protein